MPKISSAKTKIVSLAPIQFGESDFLNIQIYLNVLTPAMEEENIKAQVTGSAGDIITAYLEPLIAEWDLTEDDGTLIPANRDGISRLPYAILNMIAKEISRTMTVGEEKEPESLSSFAPAV